VAQKPPKLVAPSPGGRGWKFQYTAVLARQSWLFNQFKYLCELRDVLEASPARDGGLEMALWIASLLNKAGTEAPLQAAGVLLTKTPVLAKDRVQRWLKTLAVPVVPPCPIGKAEPIPKTPKTPRTPAKLSGA
jgi:hypothetical protein